MATSPEANHPADDDVREEYDFRSLNSVVRGKYAQRYRKRLRIVRLAEDVAPAFASEAEVNQALCDYLQSRGGPAGS